MRSRPFLIRFLWAVCGMGGLCLAVYAVVGYAVRAPHPWARKVLGYQRCEALRGSYLRVLGVLFPGDRDRDYFPDAVEAYLGSNPKNMLQYPVVVLRSSDWEISRVLSSVQPQLVPYAIVQPGERRRIRGRLIFMDQGLMGPPGAQFRLSCPTLAPPDLPQFASVTANGLVEFDLMIPHEPATVTRAIIDIDHPVSTGMYGRLVVEGAWRQPAVACGVQEVDKLDYMTSLLMSPPPTGRGLKFVRLTWPPLPENAADMLYIEATASDAGGGDVEWFPVDVRSKGSSSCVLGYRHRADGQSGKGKTLKFRMVPVRWTPGK